MPPSFPRSGVLVLGEHAIDSLVPSTIVSQVEALLDSHRIGDARDLAEQHRKKLYANITINPDELEELHYVYQRIGFQCFSDTLFEEAGAAFFQGNLDPQLLISYYADLKGNLFTSSDSLNVYAGVAEHMPPDASVDDLITANLVRNYSPHLSPNTRSAPPTAELREILGTAAQDMLELFLTKCRKRLKVDNSPSDRAVDTVLVKLLAMTEKTAELYTLLGEDNAVELSEVEDTMRRAGQYNALCMLYRRHKEDVKLLDTWSKLVEGTWTDEDIKDPLADMIALLTEKKDRALTQEWGVWITKVDPERGLKLLTSSKRKDDEGALLKQVAEANPTAGLQYLEHLVLQRRGSIPDLHEQFATALVDQLIAHVSDESTSKLWRAKSASFTSNTSSFFSYFCSTTPDSDAKRARIKALLFLQGSTMYDILDIEARLEPHNKILALEHAILQGKAGNHRAVLSILTHDMHDAVSAEIYCALGGAIIPGKIASGVAAETPGLANWANAPFLPRTVGQIGNVRRRELLRVLLEVYMANPDQASQTRAASLLDSQGVHLDVAEVLPVVPSEWKVRAMKDFLERSFRRTLHEKLEGKITKAVAEAENLAVKEKTWLILREEGMLVEEDDGEGDGDVVDEKTALQVELNGNRDPPVQDIQVDGTYSHPGWDTVEAG